jgi:hypothetical protein
MGLVLGGLATYWYVTQREQTQGLLAEWWARASRPPAAHERAR